MNKRRQVFIPYSDSEGERDRVRRPAGLKRLNLNTPKRIAYQETEKKGLLVKGPQGKRYR